MGNCCYNNFNKENDINNEIKTVNSRKSNGQFQTGMKRPENAGRKKGTPNRKTKELMELLGDYNPALSLLEILNDNKVPIELKIKINLDLMSYIYPKRKSVESKEQVLLFTNPEIVGEVTEYLDI